MFCLLILSYIFKAFLWTYTNVFNNNFRANFSLKYNSSREENPVKFRIKSRKKLRTAQQLVLVFRFSEKTDSENCSVNFNLTVKQVTGSGNMTEIEKHLRWGDIAGHWILLLLIPGSNPIVAVGLFSEGLCLTFFSCFYISIASYLWATMGTTWSPVIVFPLWSSYLEIAKHGSLSVTTNIKPFQASQVIARVFNAYVEKKIYFKKPLPPCNKLKMKLWRDITAMQHPHVHATNVHFEKNSWGIMQSNKNDFKPPTTAYLIHVALRHCNKT